MRPAIVCIEISHRTAPIEFRERIAPDRRAPVFWSGESSAQMPEGVVLNTCGRLELYAVTDMSDRRLLEIYARLAGLPAAAIGPYVRFHRHGDAARHLCRVAAGLESSLLGEDHILGQVRRAFLRAEEGGTIGPVLSAFFRTAVHVGKRVRHETEINRATHSYAHLAVSAAAEELARPRRILILGSGTLAHEVADRLAAERAHAITVMSRHVERAIGLAARIGGRARLVADLPAVLSETDVLFACTSSRRPLVDSSILNPRRGPLTIVDLGMPRNVDPAVRSLSGVRLTSLDQLGGREVVAGDVVTAAEKIIERHLQKFLRWLAARRYAPAIARLRSSADGLEPEAARRAKQAIHESICRLQEGIAA